MKFVVSSSELLSHLQAISRVISSKNSLPILDNFLFDLKGNELQITASDLESTLITHLTLENVSAEGTIAIPAKLLSDTLKEFSEQPLAFDVNAETMMVVITSQNGRFSIPGQNGSDFPQIPQIREDKKATIQMAPGLLMSGISKAIFATADDELRPVMNGIYVELSPSDITFVASDAHKLVRYRRTDAQSEVNASFILSKKPASLLKNVLGKEENSVTLEFDDKNAFFTLTNYKMVCRLIEGTYPSFNAVIPQNNPNKVIVDRVELLNTLRRVSVFANQASNLIKLDIKSNEIMISAQDIDFSISAYERIGCQYDGDEMEIGFKSSFLIEILANLASGDVVFELSDPARAGLVLPLEKEIEEEDVLMLLMPMMINS